MVCHFVGCFVRNFHLTKYLETKLTYTSLTSHHLASKLVRLCFCATFASSLPSGAYTQIQSEFGVRCL